MTTHDIQPYDTLRSLHLYQEPYSPDSWDRISFVVNATQVMEVRRQSFKDGRYVDVLIRSNLSLDECQVLADFLKPMAESVGSHSHLKP